MTVEAVYEIMLTVEGLVAGTRDRERTAGNPEQEDRTMGNPDAKIRQNPVYRKRVVKPTKGKGAYTRKAKHRG